MVAVAARTPEWLLLREEEYASRMSRFRLRVRTVKPGAAEKTAAAVRGLAPRPSPLYLLDSGGRMFVGVEFARWLGARLEERRPPVFVVGGAGGLPAPLLGESSGVLSLSRLTFAHATARYMLVEQLYRADCAMRGHPYPR